MLGFEFFPPAFNLYLENPHVHRNPSVPVGDPDLLFFMITKSYEFNIGFGGGGGGDLTYNMNNKIKTNEISSEINKVRNYFSRKKYKCQDLT